MDVGCSPILSSCHFADFSRSAGILRARDGQKLLPLFHGNMVSRIRSGSHDTHGPTYRRIIPVILFYRLSGGQKLVTGTWFFSAHTHFSIGYYAFRLVLKEPI